MRYFTKEYQAMLQSSAFVPDEIVSFFIKATKEGYDKCFASDFGETPPEFWNELMLHDCEICENFWREDDFIMVLDDGDVKVAFKKAKTHMNSTQCLRNMVGNARSIFTLRLIART